jgi:hypothetical protein
MQNRTVASATACRSVLSDGRARILHAGREMSRAHADTTGRRWWAIDPRASLAQRGRRSSRSRRRCAVATRLPSYKVCWVGHGAEGRYGDRSLAALAQLTLNRHRDQLDNLLEEEGEGRDDLARGAYLLLRARSLARTSAMSDALPLPVQSQRLRLHCPTLEDTRQVRDRYHALSRAAIREGYSVLLVAAPAALAKGAW